MYKHLTALGMCVGVGLLLTAWANQEASSTAARIMLLGEVHDNPDGHRQRTDVLRAEVEAGFRPALLMEQFDRENQTALTRAQAQCRDADCVIAAAGGKRWDWPLYKPVIELALRYRLPLIAANVSRADAGKVIGGGLAAALDAPTIRQFKLDQALPADLAARQRQAIIDGHCGKFPEEMVPGMVNAEVARDVWMAKLLAAHSTNGAVLLAGNGHVRKDVGVPRWLSVVTAIKPDVHGYVEKAEPGDAAAYDVTHVIPAHPRPDPCAELAAPRKD
jgi:uncharacterized iron-regulated protein